MGGGRYLSTNNLHFPCGHYWFLMATILGFNDPCPTMNRHKAKRCQRREKMFSWETQPETKPQKSKEKFHELWIYNFKLPNTKKKEQETVNWSKNIESDQEKLCISQIRHTIPPYIWNTWRIERQKNARLPDSRNRKAISQHNEGYIL